MRHTFLSTLGLLVALGATSNSAPAQVIENQRLDLRAARNLSGLLVMDRLNALDDFALMLRNGYLWVGHVAYEEGEYSVEGIAKELGSDEFDVLLVYSRKRSNYFEEAQQNKPRYFEPYPSMPKSMLAGDYLVTYWKRSGPAVLGAHVQAVTPYFATKLGVKPWSGVLVTSVILDTPADRAGLQPGDVIVALGNQPVADDIAYSKLLPTMRDRRETVSVQRGQKTITLPVMFGP